MVSAKLFFAVSFWLLLSLFYSNQLFAQQIQDSIVINSNSDSAAFQKPATDTLLKISEKDLPAAPFVRFPEKLHKTRLALLLSAQGIIYSGSIIALSEMWYSKYNKTKFHYFNDGQEWLQMDKVGHAMTASSVSSFCYYSFRWAGVEHVPAVLYGSALGFSYMTTIEILDGYSGGWGFSSADLAANVFGTALFMTQQLLWKSQKIKMKFSYHPTRYAQYRPSLLGENAIYSILKDYNGQTHWVSLNSSLFLPKKLNVPKWLCVSFGYGAEGMLGGFENPEYSDNGTPLPVFSRYRKVFLSLDIDFSQIPTRSKFVKVLLLAINAIKMPFPALEYNSKGQFRFHYMYF